MRLKRLARQLEKKMNFRRRFIILFVALSAIPVVLIQVFTFAFYVPSVSQRVKDLVEYSLYQKSENLRLLMDDQVQLVYKIVSDPEIAELTGSVDTGNKVSDSLSRNRLVAAFSRLSLFDSNLAGIAFVSESGSLTEYDKFLMIRDPSDFEQYYSLQAIRAQVARAGTVQFFPTTTFHDRADIRRNIFLVAFPFVDLGLQTTSGCVILLVLEEPYRNILNPITNSKTGFLTQTLLVDQVGRPISLPNDASFGRLHGAAVSGEAGFLSFANSLDVFAGRPKNVVTTPGPVPGWKLATIYDESSIFSDRVLISVYTAAIGLFLLLLSGLGSLLVYRRMFSSVVTLVESIKIENSQLDFGNERKSEFEILGTAWGAMRSKLSTLVVEVNKRNQSLVEAAEGRRIAEVRALEAQVNPHFLFNTLDTLNWMAIERGHLDLSEGVSDLASILRYSISQIDVTATLRDETEWLSRYLSLQRLRFRGNVEYEIRTNESDMDFRVYKMLIQPFVENALVHGLDPNKAGGTLFVSLAVSSDRWLKVVVRDNGRGFQLDKKKIPQTTGGIGISNVEERLKSYYQGRATLQVESSPGGGTTVELKVPEVVS